MLSGIILSTQNHRHRVSPKFNQLLFVPSQKFQKIKLQLSPVLVANTVCNGLGQLHVMNQGQTAGPAT